MHHDTETRMAALRGPVPAKAHSARTIAALTKNPGCGRRAMLDAAGVDKERLAHHIGFAAHFGQSRFALARGNAFEAQVKRNGCAELLGLLRQALALDPSAVDPAEVTYRDLESGDGGADQRSRYASACAALGAAGQATNTAAGQAADPGGGPKNGSAMFDHPLLRFEVAGQQVYLEPDLVAFQHGGVFHVVEIKSFSVIDGQADGTAVAAAATQAAVYVLALRNLLGRGDDAVSSDVVLICPENFTNRPVAVRLDVRKQLIVLRHQLSRLARVETMFGTLPAGLTLDLAIDRSGHPTRPAPELVDALGHLPARYCPDCLAHCDLAFFCRNEAIGTTAVLGTDVVESLGGVTTVAEALAMANAETSPEPSPETSLGTAAGTDATGETAAMLRTLARLYAEAVPHRPNVATGVGA